jgi:hypothetical protein
VHAHTHVQTRSQRLTHVPLTPQTLSTHCCHRYVILHQTDLKDPNALAWKVAYTPHHAWKGFKELDAFGAALDYVDGVSGSGARLAISRLATHLGGAVSAGVSCESACEQLAQHCLHGPTHRVLCGVH